MSAEQYRLPVGLEGTILAKIVAAKVKELAGATEKWPAWAIENVLDRAPEPRSFKAALERRAPAVIAELKKASPSAGLLRADFDPVAIAAEYESAGAAALSVITEVHHFRGGLENLARVRWHSRLPLLRKDFLIQEYQVLEARHAGADAVLLIAALLEGSSLRRMREAAERMRMQALVEVHTEDEMRRSLDSGATLVGVNNRDLRTFEVKLETSESLARLAGPGVTLVAESGIRTAADIARLRECGYRAFLVGETLIRSGSPGAALRDLTAGSHRGKP
jgi:indole-3-glycerol phosphate synthase